MARLPEANSCPKGEQMRPTARRCFVKRLRIHGLELVASIHDLCGFLVDELIHEECGVGVGCSERRQRTQEDIKK